jgi:4-hydroxybenzoate polyprenyltransferase/phosphoserine phosphatase
MKWNARDGPPARSPSDFLARQRLPQIVSQPESKAAETKPLCVDLDGTLVKSDTLIDSLLVLARTRPLLLFRLPAKVLHGKAAFKAFVTENVSLDVAHLPYNRRLLKFLQREHTHGREIYLATGADERLARRVADHLGIFTGVLGSDGANNLTGSTKLDRLQKQFGAGEFAYVGNDTPDLPVMAGAAESMVANPSARLRMRMRARGIVPSKSFEEQSAPLQSIVKALRPHQWAKNLLILLPPLLAHTHSLRLMASALLAFFCFCCTASGAYLVNDLLDIEADRRSAKKRSRPFASGDLSPAKGLFAVVLLFAVGFAGAHLLPAAFSFWLLVYLGATLAYSAYLKRIVLVDVVVLSGLYTLRLIAGGAATYTLISHWLAGFAIFLFLSLAIVKRFAELENLRVSGMQVKNGRGYLMTDIEQIRSFGTASAFAAVVVFANYISGQDVTALYHRPQRLWMIVPFLVLWLCRVWLLASRGDLDEDPVAFALTDAASLVMGVAVVLIVLLAI